MTLTMLVVLLLAGVSLALPTPESEEADGEVSRKILGSSVVTSVSVIMDVGNGTHTYFSDAVGKPVNKPSTATQLASPINLLNPDRYEFYTFDDSGDLVKRLMTLDEIQGIIASGDGEATNYNSAQSLSGDMPEKRVDDVVNNVQNVLKEEMEAHKTSDIKPTFDTPDITSTWNMILPAIFGGNAGDDIIPEKIQNSITAETIVMEPTTLLPLMNDTMSESSQPQVVPSEISSIIQSKPQSEIPNIPDNMKHSTTIAPILNDTVAQELKTENMPNNTDIPIIMVEITSNDNLQNLTSEGQSDETSLSSKTENPHGTQTHLIEENIQALQSIINSQTTQTETPILHTTVDEPVKIASPLSSNGRPESSTTAAPVTNKIETTVASATPSLSTIAKVTYNKKNLTVSTPAYTTPMAPISELDTSSSTHFYKKTSAAAPVTQTHSTTRLPDVSSPLAQLSTFFLIQDLKQRPESTTKVYFRPLPFTATNPNLLRTSTENILKQKPESTTRNYMRPSPFTVPSTVMTKVSTVKSNTSKTTTPTTQSTESYTRTTEEIPSKEDTEDYIPLEIIHNIGETSTLKPSTTPGEASSSTQTEPSTMISTTDRIEFTATSSTGTTIPQLRTSTTNIASTTTDKLMEPVSTIVAVTNNAIENSSIPTNVDQLLEQSNNSQVTSTTTTQKLPVTDLLNQLLLATDIHQINAELLSGISEADPTTEKYLETSTAFNDASTFSAFSTTERQNKTSATEINAGINSTSIPESDTTTEINLVSSIEQLISQAVGTPEEAVNNIQESEKINQMMMNVNSKPMSEVQVETATAASALIATPNTESATVIDEDVNQAVDSLISQIIYQEPSQTTIESYSTTDSTEIYTTEHAMMNVSTNAEDASTTVQPTTLNLNNLNASSITNSIGTDKPTVISIDNLTDDGNDDRNRYEEIDLGILDATTIKYEAKTIHPNLLANFNESETPVSQKNNTESNLQQQYTAPQPTPDLTTSTELNPQEVTYQSTLNSEMYSTTERLLQDNTISTQYFEESTKLPIEQQPTILYISNHQNNSDSTSDDISSSTESLSEATSKSNEILKGEATEFKRQNFSETNEYTSEPFLILAVGSSEYPDYTSTENLDFSTKNTEYETTTSEDAKDRTNDTTESQTPDSTQADTTLQMETSTQEELKYTSTIEDATAYTTDRNDLGTTFSTLKYEPTTTQKSVTVPLITVPNTLTSATSASHTTEAASSITPRNTLTTGSTTSNTTQAALSSSSSNTHSSAASTSHNTQSASSLSTAASNSYTTHAFVNVATVTAAPKIDKPAELKLIVNTTTSTTPKPDTTWTLVSTVVPHKTTISDEVNKASTPSTNPDSAVDLVPKPLQGFGLEDSTSALDADIFQFAELCNELAFSFWSSVTGGISFARSVIVSPFAATSMLAMVFLGARGSTSGEMNEILKLDDMVTFNPHSIFKNVIESIEVSKKSGVATSVFVKELYSDKGKGKLLNFYKERVKQFYDGHVEEINFREINDVIRRRTNLLVKRQTWGKIPEYLRDSSLFVRPPLAAVSANIFQTDCSTASTEGRDGELHFVVLPSIRQRKLIPIPAVVWRSGFLAGYDPGLDATAVAIGAKDQTISTIFVIPGQQGISAPGDGLVRLEARLIESAFRQGAWSRLLRSLIPRPGLEVQIPRFSHKSVINATTALQRMGLKDLFNSNTADLKGLNGVAHELYLSDIIQVNTFSTCGEGRIDETHHSEVYPATTNRSFRRIRKIQHYHTDKPFESDLLEEPRDYQRAFHDPLYDPSYLSLPLQLRPRQARLPDAPRLRFDRPFLYFVRHNPTGLIIHMGRFNPRLLP